MNTKIWNQKMTKPCMSVRQLRRALLDEDVKCGWPAKWGGRWSICYPDKRMVNTDLIRLSDWTLQEWVDFARKHEVEQ